MATKKPAQRKSKLLNRAPKSRASKTYKQVAPNPQYGFQASSNLPTQQHYSPYQIPPRRREILRYLVHVVDEMQIKEPNPRLWDKDLCKRVFIQLYSEFGAVRACGAVLGLRRMEIFAWRKDDPDFAEAMDDAYHDAADELELEAWRRAVPGWEERTHYSGPEGETVKSVQRHSDRLLEFMLRGRKPEIYRERVEHSTPKDKPMEISVEQKNEVISQILSLVTPKPDPEKGKKR